MHTVPPPADQPLFDAHAQHVTAERLAMKVVTNLREALATYAELSRLAHLLKPEDEYYKILDLMRRSESVDTFLLSNQVLLNRISIARSALADELTARNVDVHPASTRDLQDRGGD